MARLRIGVDVGGTFTKAVAVQPNPFAIIAEAVVPTTHAESSGVAEGVVKALSAVLADPRIDRASISAVAHSTTQAVNALLEGDIVTVGVIGAGPAGDAAQLRKLTNPGAIKLAPGRELQTLHTWINAPVTPQQAEEAVKQLQEKGAQAIVASGAYSVDDPADELTIMGAAELYNLPAVGGHQITSAYGIQIRTLTAAVNASILPRMTTTANQVEACLKMAGIDAPLLVMRGDGGLTDVSGLRTRPILSLLSGPAASIAGALLSGRILDGIFIESGGTSSNLGVIKDGQPVLRYVQIMNHPTAIRSLDVRVQGVAGGSMIRMNGKKIVDVGPRSAHIAGLPYLCFSREQVQGDLSVELIAPKAGDPPNYVICRDSVGASYALTVTCAANALDAVPENAYAAGDPDLARRGFESLGKLCGLSAQVAARQTLDKAATQLQTAAARLAKEYKLRDFELIGGGGASGALLPAVAARMKLSYRIADHAEVISSVGVALAVVREEVERSGSAGIDPAELAREATERAIAAGADSESIQVFTEHSPERGTIRAVATGALALESHADSTKIVNETEARILAARRVGIDAAKLTLVGATDFFRVFASTGQNRWLRRGWQGVVVVDLHGAIRLTAEDARAYPLRGAEGVNLGEYEIGQPATGVLESTPTVTLIRGKSLIRLGQQAGPKVSIPAGDFADKPAIVIIERHSWL